MKVLTPCVQDGLAPEVRALGESLGANATIVDLTGDDTACYRTFREAWMREETFIVLEQDVLPTVDQLEKMWRCPSDWCAVQYPYHYSIHPRWYGDRIGRDGQQASGHLFVAFGCTKFHARLLSSEDIFGAPQLSAPVGWQYLEPHASTVLRRSGRSPHLHQPPARPLDVEAQFRSEEQTWQAHLETLA